jgi:hypothetical protein
LYLAQPTPWTFDFSFTNVPGSTVQTKPVPPSDGALVGSEVHANVTLSSGAQFAVCYQYSSIEIPSDHTTWKQSCFVYFEAGTAGTVNTSVPVSGGSVALPYKSFRVTYNVGVYLMAENTTTADLTLHLAGSSCNTGYVSVPDGCAKTQALTKDNQLTITQTDSVQYFTVDLSQFTNVGALTLALESNAIPVPPVAAPVEPPVAAAEPVEPAPVEPAPVEPAPVEPAPVAAAPVEPPAEPPVAEPAARRRSIFEASTLTVYGRLAGTPSLTASDDFMAPAAPSVVIAAPQPGVWIIAIQKSGTDAVTYKITATWNLCANETAGPDCATTFAPLLNATGASSSGSTPTNGFVYYRVAATEGNKVLVSLAALNGTAASAVYTLFVGVNGLPTENSYAFKGCNQGPCTTVQVANLIGAQNGATYFVGVLGNSSAEQFALWTTTVCADNCSGRGSCTTTVGDAKYGTCQCDGGYLLVNCSRAFFP